MTIFLVCVIVVLIIWIASQHLAIQDYKADLRDYIRAADSVDGLQEDISKELKMKA